MDFPGSGILWWGPSWGQHWAHQVLSECGLGCTPPLRECRPTLALTGRPWEGMEVDNPALGLA